MSPFQHQPVLSLIVPPNPRFFFLPIQVIQEITDTLSWTSNVCPIPELLSHTRNMAQHRHHGRHATIEVDIQTMTAQDQPDQRLGSHMMIESSFFQHAIQQRS